MERILIASKQVQNSIINLREGCYDPLKEIQHLFLLEKSWDNLIFPKCAYTYTIHEDMHTTPSTLMKEQ